MRNQLSVVLLLVLAACQLCNAVVIENFTIGTDPTHIDYLWAQAGVVSRTAEGNGTTSGKLPEGSSSAQQGYHYMSYMTLNRGSPVALNRGSPVAETVLLDWDGTTPNVTFGACVHRLECLTTPGNLSLLWSNDSFVWQQLWNYTLPNPLRQWCHWANVTVSLPVTAASPRFALKWVMIDASPWSVNSMCSALLLTNITLPAQPPTVANVMSGLPAAAPNVTAANCTACKDVCPSSVPAGL